MCVHIKRYHIVGYRKGDIGKNSGGKVKNEKNDFLTEMYCRDSPLSNTYSLFYIKMLPFHPLPAKNS